MFSTPGGVGSLRQLEKEFAKKAVASETWKRISDAAAFLRQNKNNICFFVSLIEKDSIQDKKNRVFGLKQSIGRTKKTIK